MNFQCLIVLEISEIFTLNELCTHCVKYQRQPCKELLRDKYMLYAFFKDLTSIGFECPYPPKPEQVAYVQWQHSRPRVKCRKQRQKIRSLGKFAPHIRKVHQENQETFGKLGKLGNFIRKNSRILGKFTPNIRKV